MLGGHRPVVLPRENGFEDRRVGGGAPCIRTPAGWLQIYHGANREDRYSLFGALFDLEEPWRLIARSGKPLFEPRASCERQGFFGGVVFTNGLVLRGDTIFLYYGAADTSCCLAQARLEDVVQQIQAG